MLRATRKLAAQRKGNIRHVIVYQLQQSEYDLRSIAVIAFHRCILPICREHILGEIVCAEAQKVRVPDDLLRRKCCGLSLDHGPQFRWNGYPQPGTLLPELVLHHRDIIRQLHHGHQNTYVEFPGKFQHSPQLRLQKLGVLHFFNDWPSD